MRAVELSWTEAAGWNAPASGVRDCGLVLYFGTRQKLACGKRYSELREMFPDAHILGCSTGGQIRNDEILDDEIAAVALRFEATALRLACVTAQAPEQSFDCGQAIGRRLAADDLAGIFVLSDGLHVNGSALVSGINGALCRGIPLTGGLAGDGAQFAETLVGADGEPKPRTIAAVGFYGDAIRIGHGSAGGWDDFGPRRKVTRSHGNVLYELDGEPALNLYERYLGEDAQGLPGTALLFPLHIHDPAVPGTNLVRTILSVDREQRSMTFAGDMPQGWIAQLMRGNFDRLAAGAAEAARQASTAIGEDAGGDGVALLVSCIGRRLLMGQRTTDEVEAAGTELPYGLPRVGFYSYGEISPHPTSGICQLHNQTMTVTTLREAAA